MKCKTWGEGVGENTNVVCICSSPISYRMYVRMYVCAKGGHIQACPSVCLYNCTFRFCAKLKIVVFQGILTRAHKMPNKTNLLLAAYGDKATHRQTFATSNSTFCTMPRRQCRR